MFAKLWPEIEGESSSLNSASPSLPQTTHDQQEDYEKFKGESTITYGEHLTVSTKDIADSGNIAVDTLAERKKDDKRHKTTRKKGKGQ